MNLKEAFRYQNFLDSTMRTATSKISSTYRALKVTKKHLKSKANPDAEDDVEEIVNEDSYSNDELIELIKTLVDEKKDVSEAIGKAKAAADIDIDAAIEANKFRQQAASAIRTMLSVKESVTTEQGRDYKFNVEGNQTPYYYEIEVSKSEAFDRVGAKATMRTLIDDSDRVSTSVDSILINTQIDFKPRFDVNDSFEDIVPSLVEE